MTVANCNKGMPPLLKILDQGFSFSWQLQEGLLGKAWTYVLFVTEYSVLTESAKKRFLVMFVRTITVSNVTTALVLIDLAVRESSIYRG